MDASRVGEADLESDWPGTGGPLRHSVDSAMSPLVLSSSELPKLQRGKAPQNHSKSFTKYKIYKNIILLTY